MVEVVTVKTFEAPLTRKSRSILESKQIVSLKADPFVIRNVMIRKVVWSAGGIDQFIGMQLLSPVQGEPRSLKSKWTVRCLYRVTAACT